MQRNFLFLCVPCLSLSFSMQPSFKLFQGHKYFFAFYISCSLYNKTSKNSAEPSFLVPFVSLYPDTSSLLPPFLSTEGSLCECDTVCNQ